MSLVWDIPLVSNCIPRSISTVYLHHFYLSAFLSFLFISFSIGLYLYTAGLSGFCCSSSISLSLFLPEKVEPSPLLISAARLISMSWDCLQRSRSKRTDDFYLSQPTIWSPSIFAIATFSSSFYISMLTVLATSLWQQSQRFHPIRQEPRAFFVHPLFFQYFSPYWLDTHQRITMQCSLQYLLFSVKAAPDNGVQRMGLNNSIVPHLSSFFAAAPLDATVTLLLV